jgi:opacity protein-like surface antigen
LLNGYNVLADNNKNKSAGITLDFKPNSKSEIIYNNLIGNEQPAGSESKVRIYNNLVFKYSLTKKLDFLAGIDYAMQEKSKIADSTSSASVFSGLAAFRYKFSKKFSASVRGEMFSDENGMLSGIYVDSDGKSTGLKASGVTLGLEYKPAENVFVRIETRYLNADSKLKIFYNASTSRVETTLNTAVWF